MLSASPVISAKNEARGGTEHDGTTSDKNTAIDKVVYISGLTAPATLLVVAENNRVLKRIRTPQPRGLGGIFLKRNLPPKYEIRLSPDYNSLGEQTFKMEELIVDRSDPNSVKYIAEFMALLESWGSEEEGHAVTIEKLERLVAKLNGKDFLRANAVITLLHMMKEVGSYREALTLIEEEESLLKHSNLKDDDFFWRILKVKATCFGELGDYRRTLETLIHLQTLLDATPDIGSEWERAFLEISASISSLRFQLAYNTSAIGEMDNEYSLLRRNLHKVEATGDYYLTASFHSAISNYYWIKNRYKASIESQKNVLKFLKLAGAEIEHGSAYNNLAILQIWTGETHEALKNIVAGIAVSNKFDDQVLKAYLRLNLAETYIGLGEYDRAALMAQEAGHRFGRIGNEYAQSMAFLKLGTAHRGKKEYEQAIKAHTQSMNFFNRNYKNRQTYAAQIKLVKSELAEDFLQLGNIERALEVIDKSECSNVNNSQELPSISVPKELKLALLKADLNLRNKNPDAYLKCKTYIESLFEKVDIQDDHQLERIKFYSLELQKRVAENHLDEAKVIVDKIIFKARQVTSQLDTSTLGLSWAGKLNEVLDLYVNALADEILTSETSDDQEAMILELLAFLEETRSLNFRESRNNSLNPWHKVKEDESLQRARDQVSKAEQTAISTDGLEKDRALIALYEAREQLSALKSRSSVESVSPNIDFTDIEDFLQRIPANTMLLRYYIRDSKCFLISMRTLSVAFVEIYETCYSLEKNISDFIVSSRQQKSDIGDASLKLAEQIGLQKLDFSGIENLVVVPDGPLSYLPFAAMDLGKGERYIPLARSIAVVQTHSHFDYFRDSDQNSNEAGLIDIAIFANPEFSGSNEDSRFPEFEVGTSGLRSWGRSLEPLQATEKEAHSISNRFIHKKTVTYTGTEATSDVLLSEELRTAKVLHIASHGYFNEETPDVVGIATAYNQSLNTFGFVSLSNFLESRFASNLVVISGCETAVGRQVNGEGMIGLTRGVLSRGAGSVIGTLWPIPDSPTAEFMATFYEQLERTGGNSATALAATKRIFSEHLSYSHPNFWAGFILVSAHDQYSKNAFK